MSHRIVQTNASLGHPAITESLQYQDGNVTSVAVGKTWIKAHAFGNPGISDSIPVEVILPEPIDSVRISRTKTRFFVNGGGQKIDFAIYPAGSSRGTELDEPG